MAIRREHVDVAGLETKVVTFGGWIDENHIAKHVILCLPGTLGLTNWYTQFLATVHSRVGVPVWIVSHAGQELRWDSPEILKDNLDNYSLDGQTRQKVAFIKKYIPKDVKVTLIGHSIGCKMVLDALKTSDIRKQVDKCYLLFPTIERLALSPNGKMFSETIKPVLAFLIMLMAWMFHILPFIIKLTLMRLFFGLVDNSQTSFVKDYVRDVRPKTVRNVLHLFFNELPRVTHLDKEVIETFSDKLVLYYGTSDGWVPADCCSIMKETYPRVKVVECDRGIHHMFNVKSSVEMGSWVADMIHEDLHEV